MTNWYELPHKTALGLILIIARSSNVIKITAGKLFQLSIATFGDVSKTYIVFIVKVIVLIKIRYIFFTNYSEIFLHISLFSLTL